MCVGEENISGPWIKLFKLGQVLISLISCMANHYFQIAESFGKDIWLFGLRLTSFTPFCCYFVCFCPWGFPFLWVQQCFKLNLSNFQLFWNRLFVFVRVPSPPFPARKKSPKTPFLFLIVVWMKPTCLSWSDVQFGNSSKVPWHLEPQIQELVGANPNWKTVRFRVHHGPAACMKQVVFQNLLKTTLEEAFKNFYSGDFYSGLSLV